MMAPLAWFASGLASGGMLLRLIDYLIAWRKEKREQRSAKTAHERDRPRFRIDVSIVPTLHTAVPAAIVKILSLGSLPLTINDGEIFIEASHYPERVQPQKLDGREITPVCPIEFKLPLPLKLINPSGIREPVVKIVCNFSYGKDNQRYHNEKTYNRKTREFD
jgi:hypothetical protein